MTIARRGLTVNGLQQGQGQRSIQNVCATSVGLYTLACYKQREMSWSSWSWTVEANALRLTIDYSILVIPATGWAGRGNVFTCVHLFVCSIVSNITQPGRFHEIWGTSAGRSGLVVSAFDCGARGPELESHRGRLCLSWRPMRFTALGTGCTHLLQCLGWLGLLPSVRG